MPTRPGIAAVLILCAVTVPRGQGPLRPADPVVHGHVVTADGTLPVGRARIAPPVTSRDRPFVFSDDEGTFAVSAAIGGELVISKAGFVSRVVSVPRTGQIDVMLARSAAVSGRVVATDGEPIPDVRVYLEIQAPAISRTLVTNPESWEIALSASTDDRGEYRLSPAPLSPFTIHVAVPRGGTEPIRLPSGGINAWDQAMTRTFFPGTTDKGSAEVLQLRPGEDRSGIDFVTAPPVTLAGRTPPGPPLVGGTSSIAGRAFGGDGRPLAGVAIIVSGLRGGEAIVTSGLDGGFALRGLPAGRLNLLADRRGYLNSQATANLGAAPGLNPPVLELKDGEHRDALVVRLLRWGSISGQIVDEYGEPFRGASVQALQMRYVNGRRQAVPAGRVRISDDRGLFRIFGLGPGQYVVSAVSGGVATTSIGGYARSYHPGSGDPAMARWIPIESGDEAMGIDVMLGRSTVVTVSGQMLNAGSQPTGRGRLELVPSVRSSPVGASVGARIFPDGRFEFPNVTPGRYVIQAGNGRLNAFTEGESAVLPVSVGDTDVAGLSLRLLRGSDVSGHVVYDAPAATARPPLSGLELTSVSGDPDFTPGQAAVARVGTGNTLEMHGLNGPRRLLVRGIPAGWALREIRARGTDITDATVMFGQQEQSLHDVEVVLTDRVSTISGALVDDRLTPVGSARVIAFTIDPSRWTPASRYLSATTTAQDGRFTISGLPTDVYYVTVAAASPLPGADAWQDPEYLDSLIGRATRVTVNEGQQVTVTLRPPSR